MLKEQDRRRILLFAVVAALVVGVDQLSKVWIRANPPDIELLPGFLNLVYVENYGSAFGLFRNQDFLLVLTPIATLAIILLFLHYLPFVTTPGVWSVGLILGGAVGNLVDRVRFGNVTDFVDIRLWGNFHWPAFNLADSAITIGIFVLVCSLYRSGLLRKAYGHAGDSRS
jgi:signal peptidase II